MVGSEADSACSEELRPIGSQFELTALATGPDDNQPSADDADGTVELVARCLAGEERAWQEFVRRFERPVFSLCVRMLGHRQDAEDVAQESLARAVRNLHTWDATRPIMPWLMTITVNRCRTALSRRGKTPIATDFPVEPAADDVADSDLSEEISSALGELRDEYRECFILFYQQELGCAEISEVMGCPTGTIKTWLHRARRELAEHLRRRGVTPEFNPVTTGNTKNLKRGPR